MPLAPRLPRPRFPRCTLCLALVAALLGVAALAGCSGDNLQGRLRILQEMQRQVATVRTDLLLAVDSEKNALLSPTQSEAKGFLATAHAAMEDLHKTMAALSQTIRTGGNDKEKAALAAVESDFGEMAAIDATLRGLAGRNTNIRAAMLSRTEAALAVHRLQQALTPLIDSSYCPASQEALRIVTAALSILALHAQHIDESTTAGMDTLEAAINRQNDKARTAFEHLSGLLPPDADDAQQGLSQAKAAYADFWRVTGEVLKLSRENTNIEAESLTMGRKRLLTAKTLSDLAALESVLGQGEFTATR